MRFVQEELTALREVEWWGGETIGETAPPSA